MVYNSQKGRGINDLFGTLNRAFTPVLESVADVGANVATGLVSDLLSGKGPKTSIKERGNQAKTMAAQRALEKLQGGSGTKRKRSRSKSQPSKKRKQTGGIYPPIHYPLGNYPGYDRIMEGRGIFSKMRREMEKDCKDWYKRQQKGGRRPGKKRKPKKQTGAGKKRKPRKQKGSGKQTGAGKKRKPRTGKKSKSRKQTGDGLWSGLKEIFQ